MKVRAGIVDVRGMHLVVAIVRPDQAVPGVGDALLKRLTLWFPALPIMLVSIASIPRAYATFDTAALFLELDLSAVQIQQIDLDAPPPETQELPF